MASLAAWASSTFSKVTKAKPRDLPVLPSRTTVILAMVPNLPNSFSSSLKVTNHKSRTAYFPFSPLCGVEAEAKHSEAGVGLWRVSITLVPPPDWITDLLKDSDWLTTRMNLLPVGHWGAGVGGLATPAPRPGPGPRPEASPGPGPRPRACPGSGPRHIVL